MNINAIRNRVDLADIQHRYVLGEIDRRQAKLEAEPILRRVNSDILKATERLNKKYHLNRKPALLTFIAAMRNEY